MCGLASGSEGLGIETGGGAGGDGGFGKKEISPAVAATATCMLVKGQVYHYSLGLKGLVPASALPDMRGEGLVMHLQ